MSCFRVCKNHWVVEMSQFYIKLRFCRSVIASVEGDKIPPVSAFPRLRFVFRRFIRLHLESLHFQHCTEKGVYTVYEESIPRLGVKAHSHQSLAGNNCQDLRKRQIVHVLPNPLNEISPVGEYSWVRPLSNLSPISTSTLEMPLPLVCQEVASDWRDIVDTNAPNTLAVGPERAGRTDFAPDAAVVAV